MKGEARQSGAFKLKIRELVIWSVPIMRGRYFSSFLESFEMRERETQTERGRKNIEQRTRRGRMKEAVSPPEGEIGKAGFQVNKVPRNRSLKTFDITVVHRGSGIPRECVYSPRNPFQTDFILCKSKMLAKFLIETKSSKLI